MRRHRLALLLVIACSCADILGIDDGTPRIYDDASTKDVVAQDTTVPPDAGPADSPVDVGIDVGMSPLPCGTSTCNAIIEACCRLGDPSDASAQTFSCISATATCAGLKVTCANTANCAAQGHGGEECCGLIEGGVATTTTCTKTSACSGVDMCTPGDDENCAPEAGCKPSIMTILGFDICK